MKSDDIELEDIIEPKIYGLVDPNTQYLRYIGYSIDIERRYNEHHFPSSLQDNTHKNNWIKSLIKNGQKAEMIIIDETLRAEDLPLLEEIWYKYYISLGYNLTNEPDCIGNIPPNAKGKKRSEITKQKQSLALTGENNPNFGKATWNKNKKDAYSERSRKKMSDSHKDKIPTEETRKKLSVFQKGKKVTEETKKRMSEAQMGKKATEETKKKMSESHKGKKVTEETKKKMSDAHKGHESPRKGKKGRLQILIRVKLGH